MPLLWYGAGPSTTTLSAACFARFVFRRERHGVPYAEFKTTDQLFNTKIVVPRVKAHFQRGDSDVDEVTMQRIASLGLVDVTYDVLCESHGSGSEFDLPHRVW